MLPACSRTPDSPNSPRAATSARSRSSTTGITGRCSASAATWSARRDEAEDALQQTFLRAHRALLAHGAPDDPRPWLFAIARNRCQTLLAARRAEAEVDEGLVATAGLAEEVQTRADLRAVVEDVARLPDDQRAALVLAELADLSHAQIGEVIGVRAGKVKALVHQARTTLIAERDAREQPCEEIREQIATARGGALRRGPLRRHLRLCAPCRAYRDAVAAQRRALAVVLPVAPSAGLKAGILGTGGQRERRRRSRRSPRAAGSPSRWSRARSSSAAAAGGGAAIVREAEPGGARAGAEGGGRAARARGSAGRPTRAASRVVARTPAAPRQRAGRRVARSHGRATGASASTLPRPPRRPASDPSARSRTLARAANRARRRSCPGARARRRRRRRSRTRRSR